jgi:hypothetical protein
VPTPAALWASSTQQHSNSTAAEQDAGGCSSKHSWPSGKPESTLGPWGPKPPQVSAGQSAPTALLM